MTMTVGVRSLISLPPVRLRVELSEELGYMNLIAYRLPDDTRIGSISMDSGDFSPQTHEFQKTQICRTLSYALRNNCLIEEGYVKILRDHDNWFVVRNLVNNYLPEGEKLR